MARLRKEPVTTKKTKTTSKKTKKKSVSAKSNAATGLKKEYLKSKKVCKVTFRLPKIAVTDAKNAYVVGDFNEWNMYASPMKKLKSGDYTITLELEPGREYQFRYLINETKWENDWNADKYVKSPYGDSDNSVVIV
jgi:1,4-alpha-glucan branching enzyme